MWGYPHSDGGSERRMTYAKVLHLSCSHSASELKVCVLRGEGFGSVERMSRILLQESLFAFAPAVPEGFSYRPNFITKEEEVELLSYIADIPLENGRLGEYVAKRRVYGFGWGYDFRTHTLLPGPPLPPFLTPLARKVAKWLDIKKTCVVEALITEYPKGAGIGWHRDNENFEHIVGISLQSPALLRLRPFSIRDRVRNGTQSIVTVPLLPCSAYLLQGSARWKAQHSIAPVPALRYSITFRTLPNTTSLRRPRAEYRAGNQ